ncbi:MAG: hypothetical protein N4Q18_08565 [Lactobacillus crispatus]|nr:hypothetical protein [Lactobacillus crispatus]
MEQFNQYGSNDQSNYDSSNQNQSTTKSINVNSNGYNVVYNDSQNMSKMPSDL